MSLADSAAALESQWAPWDESIDGSAVTISGTAYACAATPGSVVPALTSGGWLNVQPLRVDIRKALLATPPVVQSEATWNGKVYQLQSYDGDAPGAQAWILRYRRVV
jgi:hypothetical protein